MLSSQARKKADEEGLTLLLSERNASGFQNVYINSCGKAKPYKAQVYRGGKAVFLGTFATAEEAALAFARTPEGRAAAAAAAAAPPAPQITEEAEPEAPAEAPSSESKRLSRERKPPAAFEAGPAPPPNVLAAASRAALAEPQPAHIDSHSKAKPYQARVRQGGKQVHLGYFATAEEAALALARTPALRRSVTAPSPALTKRKPPPPASPPAKRARPPAPSRAGKDATAPDKTTPAGVKHESKPPPMPKGAVVEETLQQPEAPAPSVTPSSGLLAAVAGLTELVMGLPQAKQDAALAWCAAQEVANVVLITEGRFDDAFVRALGFAPPAVAGEVVLRKRLAQLRAAAA